MIRDPDIRGKNGPHEVRAWRSQFEKDDRWPATLVVWFINGKGFHVCWEWWAISVVHLRDIPGQGPAHKRFPSATHELQIMSILPKDGGEVDPDKPEEISARGWWLSPPDLVHQFEATDEEAINLPEMMVLPICSGMASLDSDFRQFWGRQIPKLLAHMRGQHDH